MIPRRTALRGSRAIPFGIVAVVGCSGFGCSSEYSARPGWSGPLTVPTNHPNAVLGVSEDAGSNTLPCTAPVASARPHEAGNYDNRSCNAADCHACTSPNCGSEMIGGGWVYASPNGPPWVAGATITISNIDGTTIKAYSGKDGFFQIKEKVKAPYKVCVSQCPGTDCSLLPHANALCQTSNCHGTSNQRIYVSKNTGRVPGIDSGSTVNGDAGSCAPPTYGGPYTHSEYSFGQQSCSIGGCHCPPKPVFEGGFLYDGPASTKTVAEATVTLVPASGNPITVITGPDGMFFFGTVSAVSVAQALTAPYTVCVSKCPLSVCSITNGHTTTENCQSSQCHVSPTIIPTGLGNVYLR
jgi:hypothetical protein